MMSKNADRLKSAIDITCFLQCQYCKNANI